MPNEATTWSQAGVAVPDRLRARSSASRNSGSASALRPVCWSRLARSQRQVEGQMSRPVPVSCDSPRAPGGTAARLRGPRACQRVGSSMHGVECLGVVWLEVGLGRLGWCRSLQERIEFGAERLPRFLLVRGQPGQRPGLAGARQLGHHERGQGIELVAGVMLLHPRDRSLQLAAGLTVAAQAMIGPRQEESIAARAAGGGRPCRVHRQPGSTRRAGRGRRPAGSSRGTWGMRSPPG